MEWRALPSGLRIGATGQSRVSTPRCLPGWHRAQAQLGGRNPNVSLLVAIGVNDEGYREILGIFEGTRRRLVWGYPRAPRSSSPTGRGSAVVVHWYRNIVSHVASTKVREIGRCSRRSGDPHRRGHCRGTAEGCPSDRGAAPDKAVELVRQRSRRR
jgi:putative transposase